MCGHRLFVDINVLFLYIVTETEKFCKLRILALLLSDMVRKYYECKMKLNAYL